MRSRRPMEAPSSGPLERRLSVVGAALLAVAVVGGLLLAYGDQQTFIAPRESETAAGNVTWFPVAPLETGASVHVNVQSDLPVTVWLLDCADLSRVRAGDPPSAPVAERVMSFGTATFEQGLVERAIVETCGEAAVVVQTPQGASASLSASIVRDPLDTSWAPLLVVVGVAGAFLLAGGILQRSRRAAQEDAAVAGQGPVEAFLRLAVRAESWLEHLRFYLLLFGVLGLGFWYVVVLLFFVTTRGGGDTVAFAWTSAGAMVLLAAATFGWYRRLVAVDRELRAWRGHLHRLRGLEADLLAEPSP